MKKFIIYCSFILSAFVVMTSCVKDKGNYDYIDLPELYIDTVGQQVSFQVYQNATLRINPKVEYTGDASKLKYLYFIHGSTPQAFDTISTEKNLEYVVTKAPGTYTMRLEVIAENGVRAFMPYRFEVLPAFSSGWMVLYERADNPGTSEIDIIRSPRFVTGATDTVYRATYSAYNEKTLPGTPRSILYRTSSPDILVATSQTAVSMQRTDLRELQTFEMLFAYPPPPNTSLNQILVGSFGDHFLFANNAGYWATSGLFVGELTISGGVELAPFIYPMFGRAGGVFDKKKRRFLMAQQWTNVMLAYPDATGTPQAGQPNKPPLFNLNNIGRDLLFVDKTAGRNATTNDAYKLAIFKDISGPGRYVYIFDTQLADTDPGVKLLDITSAPEIQDALFYATPNVGRMVMYGTSEKVYGFIYSNIDDSYTTPAPLFTAPAGEVITDMKLYKTTNTAGGLETEPRDFFVATWNESLKKGYVYHFKVDEAAGAINSTGSKWTVDGKIGAMYFKAQ